LGEVDERELGSTLETRGLYGFDMKDSEEVRSVQPRGSLTLKRNLTLLSIPASKN
jgi:hypothetical protein